MHRRFVSLSLFFVLLAGVASSCAFSKETIKLFIVNSRDPSALRSQDLEAGLFEAIVAGGYEASVRSDSIHYGLDRMMKTEGVVQSILLGQIRKWDPDFIVIHGNRAAEKFGSFDAELFADWPLLFCGIPAIPMGVDETFPTATFLVDDFPLAQTIDFVLKMHPGLDRIVFTGTSTKLPNKYRFQTIEELEAKYKDRVVFKTYFDVPTGRMHDELVRASTVDVIVELEELFDEVGNQVHPNVFFPALQEEKNIPVYTFWHPTRDYDVVGGKFFIEELKGQRTGEVIVSRFEGRPPSSRLDVDTSQATFFWEQLKAHGIEPSDLPEGAVVLNKPRLFTERQRVILLYVVCFVAFLGCIIFVLLRNIRKRVQAEGALSDINNDLQSKNDQLKEMSRKRSEYLSLVAHDLKNPTGAISSISSSLYRFSKDISPSDREEFDEYVEIVDLASAEMLSQINTLLEEERSSMESGAFAPDLVNVSKIVRSVLGVNGVNANAKRIKVVRVEPKEDILVFVDAIRVKEIFDNLVSNAIKYSPKGATVKVMWGVRSDPNKWVFEVEDQGAGFSEKDRELLFQRFQKLSAKPTGGESSSGIGLYVTKRNVDMHDGTITLESVASGGSIFTVTLPIRSQE